MKTMVEIHVLQNFAPSNLNRDDTGAPKDAFFGGTRRARISSQCLKNAARKYFSSEKLLSEEEMAIRTKRLLGELTKELHNKGRNESEAREKAITAIKSVGFGFKDSEKTKYLIFIGKNEILNLAKLIDEKWDEIGKPEARLNALKEEIKNQLFPDSVDNAKLNVILTVLGIAGDTEKIGDEKITAVENCIDDVITILKKNIDEIKPDESTDGKIKKKKKNEMLEWEKMIGEILKEGKKGLSPMGKAVQKIFDGGKAVDLALFGRMLADMPEKNQYASCQVAHAISTHSVNREFDFFTAIDDLKPDETSASDMIGDTEYASACFYRYAVVDYHKLCENLQNDEMLSQKGLKAFINAFITAEPSGKQNSFAAHNPPELIAINVRHNSVPRNLSNAFEVPVKVYNTESLTEKSAIKLSIKAKALNKLLETEMAASKYVCAFDTFENDSKLDGLGERVESVPKLIEWVISQLDNKGQ